MQEAPPEIEALSPKHHSHSKLLAGLLVLISALLLAWMTSQRQADFAANQARLMQGAVTATSNEISLTINELRRNVTLFAEERIELLEDLLFDPQNEDNVDQLMEAIERHFPDFFSFSISQPDGTVLLKDVEGRVGDLCLMDLKSFAKTHHPYEVFTHPNPVDYHFDLPITINRNKQIIGVLLIGFKLDTIARLVGAGQLPDHKLILVKDDDPALIEVTEEGSRIQLNREIRLLPEELSRVQVSHPVANTRWLLLDLPDQTLFSNNDRQLYAAAGSIFALILLISAVLYWFLAREEQRRLLAEHASKRHNQELAESLDSLKSAQTQLIESEKLASLGSLVAGVAHEINTPIGVGLTAASLIALRNREINASVASGTLKKKDLDKYLETTSEGARILETNLLRAAELIRSFKQIAVDRTSEVPRQFLLNHYIHEVLLSLKPRLKVTRITVEVDCPEDLTINTQPGALSQVLTNLILNSLTHAYKNQEQGLITIAVRCKNSYINLVYTDDGKGIPEADKEKVFDPFFTTARSSGGSGLGLNIVYNTVIQILKGTINVADNAPKGAKFILSFPADLGKRDIGDIRD